MKGFWTAKPLPVRCGYDEGHLVPARQPIYMAAGKFPRCEVHAPDYALVDHVAVDAAIHALEATEAAQASRSATTFKGGAPVLPGFASASSAAAAGLNDLLKHTAGIKGVRRRPTPAPQPFDVVAELPDPKARAIND